MELMLDDGLQFGLGLFETIAVEQGKPVFLKWHMERLLHSMKAFGIPEKPIKEELERYLLTEQKKRPLDHHALKVLVTRENLVFTLRENSYCAPMYEKGFHADFSKVYRNETSPLIYHKSMNYGDCILEKRDASAKGLQERIFLNTRGEISEGTISNIFFIKGDQLFTPGKNAGLLPGIMRRFVMSIYKECGLTLVEGPILPEELELMQECFVTNSLMGIMPVNQLGDYHFSDRTYTTKLMECYQSYLEEA